MSGFESRGSGVVGTFAPTEVKILVDLAGQFSSLIGQRGAHGSDPALDRLLPDGYRDSAENAAEFRRFTEDDLAEAKLRNARTVVHSLSAAPRRRKVTVALDSDDVGAWLRTLTDLRLTLGTRLDVQRDGTMPSNSDAMTVTIYEWLGYLQETLVSALGD